jgi:carboxypeptidase T
MKPRNGVSLWAGLMGLLLIPTFAGASGETAEHTASRFIQVAAKTKFDRTAIANEGVSLEAFRSDSVWGFATPETVRQLQAKGFKILGDFEAAVGRGGHETLDFPPADARFHNYAEVTSTLKSLNMRHADITRMSSIGQTLEGREIWALHINTSPDALAARSSNKPGVIIMGAHHAREHLSVEIPLMFAEHLLANREDSRVATLLEGRDIWIIPMVNPDGAEFDIATGRYRMWRKNRRNNGDGTTGVDLNRNYGYQWGTGGSSSSGSSDTFMGPTPFSEPETQAIKAFVEAHLNAKVLLTVHTFSELILYPWGHKYDGIENARDLQVFETMARTMAGWNRYKPQQASDLYIASGDTTDWAYGTHGIFAFTFELSPASQWDGGFYPGAGVIDRVFNDNLRPLLYLLDVADDPYKVLAGNSVETRYPGGSWLKNYVEPTIPYSSFWQKHPY